MKSKDSEADRTPPADSDDMPKIKAASSSRRRDPMAAATSPQHNPDPT